MTWAVESKMSPFRYFMCAIVFPLRRYSAQLVNLSHFFTIVTLHFYFATHTPMLFVQYKNGIQDEIVIFEVDRSILKAQGVLFTDGNATNQQLSKYMGEVIDIIPATKLNSDCRRRYRPSGP